MKKVCIIAMALVTAFYLHHIGQNDWAMVPLMLAYMLIVDEL